MAQLAVPLMVTSSVLGFAGNMSAASQARQVGAIKEQQYQRQGRLAFAGAQRKAAVDQHTQDLIASRAQALMAAGGGTADAGNINLMADITGEGAYRKALDLYQGKEKLKDYYKQGEMAKMGANMEASQYQMKAFSSVLSGATSIAASIKST